ncbi:hypothetical protein Taro_008872, partial [Colocasia esculenta]|nr:hypothetical protein [Colocasia esculenta]
DLTQNYAAEADRLGFAQWLRLLFPSRRYAEHILPSKLEIVQMTTDLLGKNFMPKNRILFNLQFLSNPSPSDFNDGGPPPLGLEALSEHGVDWPSRDQPSPGPEDEDLWNFIVGRVRAVVDSEDPPSIDAIKRVLKEKTMLAFNSGIAQNRWMDADRCSSRLAEVRKGWKAWKLKITAETENIVRLQRKLKEARSSLEQEVKDDTKDSEEEAAFIKDDEEHRRSTSSKTKEVERLKRKKPSWLRFELKIWFDLILDFGFDLGMTCLDGLLAMGLDFFGFDMACLDGLLTMTRVWLAFVACRFGYACLGGLLAMVLELDLDMTCHDGLLAMDLNWIAYLCGLLAMVLKFGFDIAYLCAFGFEFGFVLGSAYFDGLWLHLIFGFDIHPGIGYGFELNLGLGYSPPWWLAGYGLNFGFEIAYLCGFLAMNLKFGFDVAYLCGLLAMVFLNLELGFVTAYLCDFLAIDLNMACLSGFLAIDLEFGFDIAYLCGLLAMVLEFEFGYGLPYLPLRFAGYGFELGFDIAYLCGLLAMVLEFEFDIAYLCGLLAIILEFEFGFDIAYLCGLLAMDLKFEFGIAYLCGLLAMALSCI